MDRRTAATGYRYVQRVLPLAVRELRRIERLAATIPDEAYRAEALASVRAKDFHVYGGCILAAFLHPPASRCYVELVAAFESAVDYLDNLCDRLGHADEADFRALHESLIDAVTPGAPLRAYFRHRAADDGGYLAALVARSQAAFGALPSYAAVSEFVADVTSRYCELQARKHLGAAERARKCEEAFSDVAPDLTWWEGAAACGSTMPTFALAYQALDPACDRARAAATHRAYFPYFSGLHILLDYFIDQAEDREHRELNFVACYASQKEARDGMLRLLARAGAGIAELADADRHRFALRAMCAFYCTRPQVSRDGQLDTAREILRASGIGETPASAGAIGLQPLLALYARVAKNVL